MMQAYATFNYFFFRADNHREVVCLCRLGTEGETFSGAGPYNPAKRMLTLDIYNRGVAVQNGSTTFNGLFFTISSIPILNAGFWVNGAFDIVFNEARALHFLFKK